MNQSFEEIELLGARSGIDVRHPFADRDVVDFGIALPHAVKASTVRIKPLLRDALADLLPQSIAEREDKTQFAAVIDARVDFDACYRSVRDSGIRLPDLDYGRLFRDAARPVNDRIFWTRLAKAHVFLAGTGHERGVPGCHGIAVAPASLGLELGWLTERPPLAVDVELVRHLERALDAELVWQLDEPAGLRAAGDHHPDVAGDRPTRLGGEHPQSVSPGRLPPEQWSASPRRKKPPGRPRGAREHRLPLVAQRSGALVLHASAACIDGSAVMLCAESGSGKSSLLMGLVRQDGTALSEDQCVIDLDPTAVIGSGRARAGCD